MPSIIQKISSISARFLRRDNTLSGVAQPSAEAAAQALEPSSSRLNPESSLLPYTPSALPPGPWLVFAPHADDETYGMGGALLLAKAQKIETHVVVLTDGALGGEACGGHSGAHGAREGGGARVAEVSGMSRSSERRERPFSPRPGGS